MYVLYSDDGTIESTVIGPDQSYGNLLDQQGRKWLFVEGQSSLDIRQVYVDPSDRTLKAKAEMPLVVSKSTIVAGGEDTTLVSGIPTGAMVQVLCNDQIQAAETITDGEIEFAAAAPASYRFLVSCARFLPAEVMVTAQ